MVSFTEAVGRGFAGYVDFRGRATRAEFWWFALFLTIVGFGASALDIGFLHYSWEEIGPGSIVFLLATLVPSISIGARRLHDIDMSGWWQLVIFVPIVGIVLLTYWWCKRTRPSAQIT